MAWNDPRFLDLGPSHGAWLESQEHDPSQNAWSREKGKHAMATGQEFTPGQNASLDIWCELISSSIVINKFSPKPMSTYSLKKKVGYIIINLRKIK